MFTFSGRGILLDIEGTTTSPAYIHTVLYPFALAQLDRFLHEQWDSSDLQEARDLVARDAGAVSFKHWCGEMGRDEALHHLRREILRLTEANAKTTGLKYIQGLIWRDGFTSGQFTTHVYDDVPAALHKWKSLGMDIRIYSSGSVTTQQMLFGHTCHGDLQSNLAGHYDTTLGKKTTVGSYLAIAADMGLAPKEIIFVSDVIAELDAAEEAHFQTALMERDPDHKHRHTREHPVIHSLLDLRVIEAQ